MKIKSHVNTSGFAKKMAALRSRQPAAVSAGTAALGAGLAAQMIFLANPHRNTNRFARSLEEAHNDLAREAGTQLVPESPILPSRDGEEIRDRLEIALDKALNQEKLLRAWIDHNRAKPGFKPSWKSHRRLLKAYDDAGNVTDRAIEALDAFNATSADEQASAIVIYGSKSRRKTKSPVALRTRNLDRAIIKRFGGRGAVVSAGSSALATVASFEPHARIVDRRQRIGSRATANLRRLGVRTFNPNYLRRLGKESGVNPAKLTGIERSAA